MRTLSKLLLALGLALTLSAPAGAVVSIGLVQVGGTFNPSVGAQPGDTLVLSITYSIDPGDTVMLIEAAIYFDGSVQSFNAAGSTETAGAVNAAFEVLSPIVQSTDIGLSPYGFADGWEKANVNGWTGPCTLGACTSLGTAAFVLTGNAGVIAFGGIGLPGGTQVLDGNGVDITSDPTRVRLEYFVPEPASAVPAVTRFGLALAGVLVLSAGRLLLGRRPAPAASGYSRDR
jgi:hypothetical protein